MRYLSSVVLGSLLSCSDDLVLSTDGSGGGQIQKTLIVIGEPSQSNGTPHEPRSDLTTTAYGDLSFGDAYPNVDMVMKSAPDTGLTWEYYDGPMSAVTFNGAERIGLYASALRALDLAAPGRFAVLIYAIGGSSSIDWATYHADFMALVASTMAAKNCTRVVKWSVHGEADSRNLTLANNYDDYRASVDAAWRAVYPTSPIIANQLNINVNGAFYIYKTELRASNVNWIGSATNATLLDVDDIAILPDGAHYGANALMQLGERFAVATSLLLGDIHIPPVASFTQSIAGRRVIFDDTTRPRGSAIVSWSWSGLTGGTFNNGTSATSENPDFTFTQDGTYSITVTATDAAGKSHTSPVGQVSVIGGIAGVTRDADSANYVPANATEMRTFLDDGTIGLSAKANAIGIQLCQETGGVGQTNLADSIGTVGAMAAANTPSYGQDIAGMTRNGVSFVDGSAKAFSTSAAALPNIATEPILVVAQVEMPASAPAGSRNLIAVGVGANRAHIGIEGGTGKLRVTSGANVAVSASSVCNGALAIIALRVVPGVGVSGHLGSAITVSPTLSGSMSGERLEIGAQSGALAASTAKHAWQAEFAEAWTVPEVQTLITGLEGN